MESGGNADFLLDYAAGKLKAEARAQMERIWQAARLAASLRAANKPYGRRWTLGNRLRSQWISTVACMPASTNRPPGGPVSPGRSNPLFRHALPIGAAAGVVLVAGLLMNRPAAIAVAPVEESAQVETLQPEQVEHALDDIEMLRELNQMVPDHAAPKM